MFFLNTEKQSRYQQQKEKRKCKHLEVKNMLQKNPREKRKSVRIKPNLKSCFFEKMNKFNKVLARLMNKKR